MTAFTPLQGKAKQAADIRDCKIKIYDGAVRSGKTVGSEMEWIEFCRTGPAGNLLMVGRTERTVINNVVLPLQEMLGKARVKILRGLGMVNICGRAVLLIGANNEEARTKIQGITLAGAYVDEAPTLPESFWNMLVSRLSVAGARLFATCNPEGPRHWLKTGWLDRARLWIDQQGRRHDRTNQYLDTNLDPTERPLDLARVSFRLEDNAHNLPDGYIDEIKASYSGLWYKRMIDGEWSIAEGTIYEMFNPAIHVVSDLPQIAEILCCGIDYGVTNATRGEMLALGVDGNLYVTAEWAPGPGTEAQRSTSLRSFYDTAGQPDRTIVDPAAAGFRQQLVADDFPMVLKGNNRVVDGLGIVASLFKARRLFVHESCTELLGEIPGYVWDAKASEKGEDAPVKLDDHACDALRYAVMTTRPWWQHHIDLSLPTTDTAEEAAA